MNDKNRTQTGHNYLGKLEKQNKKTGHKYEIMPSITPSKLQKGSGERSKAPNRAAKDQQAYWKTKVKPRIVRGIATPELYVRLFEGKREAWICCDSSNVLIAATKARDHYVRMTAVGLPALLEELKPDAMPAHAATVGEFIANARNLCRVRPRTLAQYETSLRRIVAGVCRLDGDERRFDYKTGGAKAWRERVDSVPLDRITPAAVQAWRITWCAAAKGEKDRTAREHSAATYIRNARSLFAVGLLDVLRERIHLPDRLPFAGLSAAASTRRFVPTVDAHTLYADAWHDLSDNPDTLAAFLLLIAGGLRRAEADLLPWAHLDLTSELPYVRIAETAHFRPNTEESARQIPLPADVNRFLSALRAGAPHAEFVLEGKPPKAQTRTNTYRADAWEPLTAWLRTKGVKSRNPLHEVRKLSGSLVNSIAGLEAARHHLGHANIATTSGSYVAARSVTVDLSAKPNVKS